MKRNVPAGRRGGQGAAPAHIDPASRASGKTTLPSMHRGSLHSPLRQLPQRRLVEPVGLAQLLLPVVGATAAVAWCQPTPTREEDISLPLLR